MQRIERKVLEISHISARSGNSFRVTLPKKVVDYLELTEEDLAVVFVLENGKIVIEKLKHL